MNKGYWHVTRGYWEATAEPSAGVLASYPAGTVEVPIKPGETYEWDGSAWVDNPPDPAAVLAEKRSLAFVSRAAFFIGVWKAGILSRSDAEMGSRGEMPTDFTLALTAAVVASQITQAEADEATILLAGAIQIDRTNEYVALMQAYYSLTDAQVDALFGIT